MQEEKKVRKLSFLEIESEKDKVIDKNFLFYEILASKAHVIALEKSKIITKEEASKILNSLNKLIQLNRENKIEIGNVEDIHFFVEDFLIKELGLDIGGKLHIGRSRNELIINDIRLYLRDWINSFSLNLLSKIKELLIVAEKNKNTIFPSYTHLQQAQPISFGYYILAHAEFFIRIYERLRSLYDRVNVCVLGSGAIAGINWEINRKLIAKLLGFSKVSSVSFDSINSRGEIESEILFIISLLCIYISRICEDFIIYSSQEFNLIEIPSEYSGISSIMPQKKNPDALELIRGLTSSVVSSLFEVLIALKSLPSGYNKDLQITKQTLLNSLKLAEDLFNEIVEIICKVKVKEESFLNSTGAIYTIATDVADFLVMKLGISFREAHNLVSSSIKKSQIENKDFLYILQDFLKNQGKNINLSKFRNIKKSINRKKTYGSTNPLMVKSIIRLRNKSILKEERKILKEVERIKNHFQYLMNFSY